MKIDLKLYRGYMNDQELIVFGHVFKSWAPDHYRIDRRGIRYAISIFRMFTITPMPNASVTLQFKGLEIKTKTLDDGYFRFAIPVDKTVESGWHPYTVICEFKQFGMVETGELLKPFESKYGIISDIDDTFLISHSNNFLLKIYVLLSKNINKRKIYKDVAEHFKELSRAGQKSDGAANSFFYVSSSEWNLYGFIEDFATLHDLPKAVIKLKKIKTGLMDFLFTGKGSHDHKFEKIKDIISFYPRITYVLFGDDSQKDPFLYERICKIFPQNILVVYIRQTTGKRKSKVVETLTNIESLSVKTLYYQDSSEAIVHSKSIGIL
ncbi:MAG: App1 family protein [Aquaticitalea sp.]